jgi:putative ABC transport system ATP-binding protein
MSDRTAEASPTVAIAAALVGHDPVAASFADRVVVLADGRLAGSLEEPFADAIAERMAHLGQW